VFVRKNTLFSAFPKSLLCCFGREEFGQSFLLPPGESAYALRAYVCSFVFIDLQTVEFNIIPPYLLTADCTKFVHIKLVDAAADSWAFPFGAALTVYSAALFHARALRGVNAFAFCESFLDAVTVAGAAMGDGRCGSGCCSGCG